MTGYHRRGGDARRGAAENASRLTAFLHIWQNGQLMDRKLHARYEARARIAKALAHPTRLFLVDELARRERCVCEITEMVGSDISTVSKHLAVLKAAGIVTDEKRGARGGRKGHC